MKRNDSRSFGLKYKHPHSCRVFFNENANRCFSQRPKVKIKIKYRKQIRTDTIEIYTFGTCIMFIHDSRYYGDITTVVEMDGSPSHWIFFVYPWFIHTQFVILGRIDDSLLMTFSKISIKGHRIIFTQTGLGLLNI